MKRDRRKDCDLRRRQALGLDASSHRMPLPDNMASSEQVSGIFGKNAASLT